MVTEKELRAIINKHNINKSSDEEAISPTVSANAYKLLKILNGEKLTGFKVVATPMGTVDFEYNTGREILILTAEPCDNCITLEQTPCGIFDPFRERYDLSVTESRDELIKIVQEITC